MPLIITMKQDEKVVIETKSGDKVSIELPRGTTKQSRIAFFGDDNVKIQRYKKSNPDAPVWREKPKKTFQEHLDEFSVKAMSPMDHISTFEHCFRAGFLAAGGKIL
jgi:hypothetical protein